MSKTSSQGSHEPISVYSFPPAFGLCSASPFCLKLETWLRMAGIPYKQVPVTGAPASSTGKAPYIGLPDGTLLADSQLIIEMLTRTRGIALDEHLSELDLARSHHMRRSLEEGFYFVVLWRRWEHGWAVVKPTFFGGMPPVLRSLVPAIVRRSVLKSLHGQGTDRHSPEMIQEMGKRDLAALSELLGDQDWFFGKPSSFDAVAYGFIAQFAITELEGPLESFVLNDERLMGFVERMKATYWSD